MKILHVISSVNPAGGGPIEGVRQLGSTLERKGHIVEIASLDSPSAPYLKQSLLRVYPLGPSYLGYGYSSKFVPWLRSNSNRYDVVIVNGIWQYHSLGTWQALHRSQTPYVLFTHGMLDPWFKKEYPLKHAKKWMYWPWAEYRVLRDARAVLFTCEEERRLARESFSLYRCNEVVVSYGTAKRESDPDVETREFLSHHPELRGKRLALFMGRIHPKKGCDLLVEAFAKVLGDQPDWHLVIAGPDQVGLRESLHRRLTELGVAPRVTWTGMLMGEMKWGALRSAEVFVLPSHQENFGIAVAEALAVGTPALISNKVNIWREVELDRAGIVSADTQEGTFTLLRSYVEMTNTEKSAMRQAARECFMRRFEIGKAAEHLHRVLTSVVKANCALDSDAVLV